MSSKTPGWKSLITLCQSADDQGQLSELLQLFLTEEEKRHLSKRLLLIREILRGKLTQREIAKTHQISITKITRGSNLIKQAKPNHIALLKEVLLP